MYPNNTQQQNTLTVVTTATIQLNLDGTWNVIAFESDDKEQTKIDTYNWNWEKKYLSNEELDKLPSFQELPKPLGTGKLRKIRAKETKQRKPRIRSHCKKCGMKGKNVLTCLSTVDRKGNPRSQHHRI